MSDPILEGNELSELTWRVANLYWFQVGPIERRTLIQQAGLSEFLPFIYLAGDPVTVAGDLLSRLDTYGTLDNYPTYHALGRFLAHLLTLPALDKDNRKYAAGLIVRRGLVRDPGYIEDLRERYRIVDLAPPPSPAAAVAPAPSAGGFPASPEFTPQISDADALERVINSEDNFLDIHVLQGAVYAAQAVARVEIGKDHAKGTGFLIGPDLFLTCKHVITQESLVKEAVLRFDYVADPLGSTTAGKLYKLQPGFYYSSPKEKLDYALVRVDGEPLAGLKPDSNVEDVSVANLIRLGKHRGYLVLFDEFIGEGQRVNIIQHPDGRPLKVVLTQNRVVADMTETRVQYTADTMGGSSGSPVLNARWEVIALHHSGKPYPPGKEGAKGQEWRGQFVANEGVPMRAILADLKAQGLEPLLMQK